MTIILSLRKEELPSLASFTDKSVPKIAKEMDIVTNFAGLERSLYRDSAVVTIATNDHT